MRTNSRSRWSKSTLSSSLVAACSRWAIARAKPAAWASKSSRTGISEVLSVIVIGPTLCSELPTGKVYIYARLMGHFRGGPAPGAGRQTGPGRTGERAARGRADRPAAAGDQAAVLARAGPGP